MSIIGTIVGAIARILHPDKPREWFENVRFPTDLSADEVITRLNAAAEGTPLAGWYKRRSIVDLMKLSHPDNPDEAASFDNRKALAHELGDDDYSGKDHENVWLFDQVMLAIQQRGIPLPG